MQTYYIKIILLILFIYSLSITQNPTTYPYGGEFEKYERGTPVLKFYYPACFMSAKFNGSANFESAKFNDYALFSKVKFNSYAYFDSTHFNDNADFGFAQFNGETNFEGAQFDGEAYFGDAHFDGEAYFDFAQFNSLAYFGNAWFDKTYFSDAHFYDKANFEFAHFDGEASFECTHFDGEVNFSDALFDGETSFLGAQLDSIANFGDAHFDGEAYFGFAQFINLANFRFARFDGETYFSETQFDGLVYFESAHFFGLTDFEGARFKNEVLFEGCNFKGILNLSAVKISKGLDLRRAIFDSVETIYIDHHITYPEGKLRLYWDQFKGRNKLRIKLYDPPKAVTIEDSSYYKELKDSIIILNDLILKLDSNKLSRDSILNLRANKIIILNKEKSKLDSIYNKNINQVTKEHYQRIETFYFQLRDNFLAQGEKSSADAVMYELGWQRKEIKGEWWWILYGWFFGWGYQPWRFLIFVVAPLIVIFAYIWFRFFYNLVVPIVWLKIPKPYQDSLNSNRYLEKIKLFKMYNLTIFNHSKYPEGNISYLARLWHVIHFSASVLLGIRFKKEWINEKNKKFLNVITLEWAIGILCYVTFALLVKGVRFGFIKDILGF